jgi:RepB DNA-primase N-terminal domain/RepB DNA-primase C-terminal helical domain
MKTQANIAPGEYILDLYERLNRVAILALNRDFREIVQRITSADKAASPDFQAWLRHKNASGSDIYIGMNPLKQDAATRTKNEIESIRHVYIDLDYGGTRALEGIRKSSLVPKPNYVLRSSPDKFQVVWKVEGIKLHEAEALLHALAREFGGDPAATDASRVLRLPGFANKKYGANFYVEAHKDCTETYHLRDFKLHTDAQESPRHHYQTRTKRDAGNPRVTQSELDWAFAKRALSRGDDPEAVIQQIAEHRSGEKSDPQYYARLTVTKALAELGMDSVETGGSPRQPAKEDRVERS